MTKMRISSTMDLDALIARMSDHVDVDRSEARRMRDLLVAGGYAGQDTSDVPEAEWLTLLGEAVEHELDAAERALREAGFAIGDCIIAGDGKDRERGRIVSALDATRCEVEWQQGARTPCAIDDIEQDVEG